MAKRLHCGGLAIPGLLLVGLMVVPPWLGAVVPIPPPVPQPQPEIPTPPEQVRLFLAEVVSTALTEDGLDDVVRQFAEADRERLTPLAVEFPELDQAIERFRQRWQQKYGEPFQLEAVAQTVMQFVEVELIETTANPRMRVTIPPREGMPAVQFDVILEDDGWRMDVPPGLAPERIRNALLSGLRPILEGQPPLPDDKLDAYRSTVQGTLAALHGQVREAPTTRPGEG